MAAGARSVQHAASNLKDGHVEIVCAAQIRVNVMILYQPLTAPNRLGLLGVSARGRTFRSGGARLGRSQKDGLPTCRAGERHTRFKAINSRTVRGSLVAAPFLIGSKSGRQDARPCVVCCPVARLCRSCLVCGSPIFSSVFCARCSCNCGCSGDVLALIFTETPFHAGMPRTVLGVAAGSSAWERPSAACKGGSGLKTRKKAKKSKKGLGKELD